MSAGRRAGAGDATSRIRRGLALAGCGVLTVGATACASTEQESARIGRESAAAVQASGARPARRAAPTHARGRQHSPQAKVGA
jgi:hypothetical protein